MNPIKCKLLNQSYSVNFINGSMSHCCRFKSIIADKKEIDDLQWKWFDLNYETVKAREDLKNGIKTERCIECWKAEDLGEQSWRQIHNTLRDNSIQFNIEISNLCNQSCFYCSPLLSSTISKYKKWITHDGSVIPINFNFKNTFSFKHATDFVNNFQDTIENFSLGITGGEPFIVDQFDDIIEEIIKIYFYKNKNRKFNLDISTNTNVKIKNLLNFYEKINKLKNEYNISINIISSIENLEEKAEYVRDGLDWNNFLNNFKVHNYYSDRHSIRMTINPFSIVGLVDFVKFFNDNKINFFLYNFPWQDYFKPRILDKTFLIHVQKFEEYIIDKQIGNKFNDNWYTYLKKSVCQDDKINAKIFKQSITNIDLIKGTNWKSVFPEYIEWFEKI